MAEEGQALTEGKSSKLGLIIVVAVLLVALPAGAFFVIQANKRNPQEDPQELIPGSSSDISGKKKEIGSLIFMDTIVNIADTDGNRYLKIVVALEMSNKKLFKEIERRRPQLTDILIEILRRRDVEELTREEGPENVRREIIKQFNSVLITGKIVSVYFTEFLIQ